MTLDQIDLMVRDANPVPDPKALDPGAAPRLLDQRGRTEVQDRLYVLDGADPTGDGDTASAVDASGHRWWPFVAAAAAFALIIVGALVATTRRNSTEPQIPAGPSSTEAAETAAAALGTRFVDAYGDFDATQAISYLSDDAELSMAGSVEELRRYLFLLEAEGFRLRWNACRSVGSSPDGTELRCPFTFDDLRSDEMGLGPYSGSYFDLTVRDGKIVRASKEWDVGVFSPQVWEPFLRWLAAEHPDDADIMLEGSDQRLSDRSIRLWEQRTHDYVAYRIGTGRGFIGLPPVGATPSTPEHGELVEMYPVDGGGLPFRGAVRLYADGRMIWYRFLDTSQGANTASTGYLEQRLTPEGVEMVRTHPSLLEKDPVRLPGWLPDSAWEDQEIRAYVPTGYAVCLNVGDADGYVEERVWGRPGTPSRRSRVLALLPASAADLLRGKEAVPPLDDAEDCLALTTDEARLLDRALADAGFEQDEQQNAYLLDYALAVPGQDGAWLDIRFEPIYPDGSIGCSACG
jgi:hypothetical protein